MWQRFTVRARKVVFYAQEEARRLGENYVSTEHLLLGLIREPDNPAGRILNQMRVDAGLIRSQIERQVAKVDGQLNQDMQITPRAKRVIDLAYDEARQLGNNYIGTEHLLLGLIREGEGLAGRTLAKLGADLAATRKAVTQVQLAGGVDGSVSAPVESGSAAEVTSEPLAEQSNGGTPSYVTETPPVPRVAARSTGAYTAVALRVLMRSYGEAARLGMDLVKSEHLLLAMLREPESLGAKAVRRLGVATADLLAEVDVPGTPDQGDAPKPEPSVTLTNVVSHASSLASAAKTAVGTDHFLLAMVRDRESSAGERLGRHGVVLARVREVVAALRAEVADPEGE